MYEKAHLTPSSGILYTTMNNELNHVAIGDSENEVGLIKRMSESEMKLMPLLTCEKERK